MRGSHSPGRAGRGQGAPRRDRPRPVAESGTHEEAPAPDGTIQEVGAAVTEVEESTGVADVVTEVSDATGLTEIEEDLGVTKA